MKCLALDPSSTACGYAVMTASKSLIEAGKFTPDMARPAELRAYAMAREALMFIEEQRPTQIVVEFPTPKPFGRGQDAQGIATYGVAVGVIWGLIFDAAARLGYFVYGVRADEWTSGCRKPDRVRDIAYFYRDQGYDAKQDPGGDVADAIALGQWWLTRQELGVAPPARVKPRPRRSRKPEAGGLFAGAKR